MNRRAVGVALRGAVIVVLSIGAAGGAAARQGQTQPPPDASDGEEVSMVASDVRHFPASVGVVLSQERDIVLRVTASGFSADSTGSIQQCVALGRVDTVCRDTFPVRFDGDGTARIQYRATSAVGDVPCDIGAGCAVVLRGEDGATPALVYVVFGPTAPRAGHIHLEPATSLRDGQTAQVTLRGFPPLSTVKLMLCAAPAVAGDQECGAPGPVLDVKADAEGAAVTNFEVRAGSVGRTRQPCGRGAYCGLLAVATDAPTTAVVAPISFSAGAGAGYNTERLLPGLGIALLFAAAAAWLIRRTDWRPPSEAATPELDALP